MDLKKDVNINTTSFCQEQLLSLTSKSKDEFLNQYKKYGDTTAKELYIRVLVELEKTIIEDNINMFKKLSKLVDYISNAESPATIKDYYNNTENSIKSTNLIILACKHNKVSILKYLFNKDTKILNNLSVAIGQSTVFPDDEDELSHNAFYYAIGSGNVNLLHTLISEWPGNYFSNHPKKLDEVLSKTFDELKLKNVPLLDEMDFFIEDKLVNLRFFSNTSQKNQNVKSYLNNIKERVDLVLQNVSLLKTVCPNTKVVGEKFIFIVKFIAQNIHVLKRQLKSSYYRLPWEELEFCLVCFVSSHTKQQEITLFYNVILDKNKILDYLDIFAKKLEEEKKIIENICTDKLAELPKVKREKVVAEIIGKSPQFEALYMDYQQIRDIHSLEKISYYIKLALSSDPGTREGQLIITRVLQVSGEYLKNTLESPNLSNTTSDLLLLSLPKNTREVIIDLRNSLSHAYSLCRRTDIEKSNINFFIGVQNDSRKIDNVITEILFNYKIRTIRTLLQRIIHCESLDEIEETAKLFSNVKLNQMVSENFKLVEHEKLENLFKELSDHITDKTNYEKELFNKINNLIDNTETQAKNVIFDFMIGVSTLMAFSTDLNDNKIDHNVIRGMKFRANHILEIINPKIKLNTLKEVAELSMKLFCSVRSRQVHSNIDNVYKIICEILYIAQFEIGDIRWIEELRENLNKKGSFIPKHTCWKSSSVPEEKSKQLGQKLLELKNILSNKSLTDGITEKLPFYKSNKKLQAVVEMLVLDIMSILGSSKHYLANNLFFLDDNTPLLTGKCLRNHLAHDNGLANLLSFDPSIAVILNAKKLTEENIITNTKKIGKIVSDNPFKLREKCLKGLDIITYQENMFSALENGNSNTFKDCLEKGADIKARSIKLWTALHFAAKGSNSEVIKFILNQSLSPYIKDINGQSPLHVAAMHGRKDIVELFIKEADLDVNDLDNSGKSPLHLAAQNGHKSTVEILLKYKANTGIQDVIGLFPLYYAIRNNHIEVVKILLVKDANVDVYQTLGGFTPLHEAAESGHLQLVKFLLQKKADINAKNDRAWTPLHAASFNGHVDIVNTLILKGANVNATGINGCTALYYAVEGGHEKIAKILLQHGANVNTVNKTYNTPLHSAIKDGHEGIVTILLENKANPNIETLESMTPLHFAAQSGHFKIVSALLKHGVNIHAKDKNNATPLHYAVESGHIKVADVLIKNQTEVNAKTFDNLTPLHISALKGYKDITDLLIRNKAKVNAQDSVGSTPLHKAAINGNVDVIDLLIKNKAEVDAKANEGVTPLYIAALNGNLDAVLFLIEKNSNVNVKNNYVTPLHAASLGGHKDIIRILLKNKAFVNERGPKDITPLHVAIEAGNIEIVNILIANGANINIKSNDLTPLLWAIKCNHKEIVDVLVANGANIDAEGGKPLFFAVHVGNVDIVESLLKNKVRVNIKGPKDWTPLHVAAERGFIAIVKLLITNGANIDAMAIDNITPLYLAAQKGHEQNVKILIANGANVNFLNFEDAPIHIAAGKGYDNIIKILINNGAKIDLKDNLNRTALELAVAHGHLKVVKILLQYKKIDMDAKGNDDWTILHIASQSNNLDIVKCLINEGSNINARNASGSKPIHIAAREGLKNIVDFFLNKGLSINEPGAANQTLLHYAAMKGHEDIVKYLITKGADVNVKDENGLTPMHIAAIFNYKEVIKVLLQNCAIYNSADKFYRRPLNMVKDRNIVNILTSCENLLKAVKANNSLEVEMYIKAGAVVNAKNAESYAALHYAAWKGYERINNILLENKANPNVLGQKGFTPLHYASKFSHFKVVETLLSYGAIYNAISSSGKSPLDISVNESITSLLKFIDKSFERIKNNNSTVIDDLNKIKDIKTIKAIMAACNKEGKTLVVAAIHSGFLQVEQLKEISQGDVSSQVNTALKFIDKGDGKKALRIFTNILERRKKILGEDNPGTLDIQKYIAKTLFNQGKYQEALNILKNIFEKEKQILGLNNVDTLNTGSTEALTLHRLGRDKEAFDIFQEVYSQQKVVLGPSHPETLDTHFHLALVLERLGKFEEALTINESVFKTNKEKLGAYNAATLRAQNNIALVLASQGKYTEALKIYEDVLEKKKVVLGIHHVDTLRTIHNIAGVLCNQKKYPEALKAHQELFKIQKKILGPNHPDTLLTQYNIANVLFAQQKWIGALKAYKEGLDQRITVLGSTHPSVLDTLKKIQTLNLISKMEGTNFSQNFEIQKTIHIAANDGDTQSIQRLIKEGADTNDKDIDGRTPLHFAVNSGHMSIVNILLKNGADVTQVTNKGNTPLHTAASKGYKDIVEVLLRHVSRETLNYFINAKTYSGGSTSLHVAAKNGFIEIIKILLNYGGIYNIKDKKGKTPLALSKNLSVTNLLNLLQELFQDARNGKVEALSKLKIIKPDEFIIVTKARDNQGNTLLQVAIANGHKNVARKMLEMLKKPD